jgi:peptide deformylase
MIIKYPNEMLKTTCEPISFDNSDEAWDIGVKLIDERNEHKAAGVAAPQIGLNKRIFVVGDNFVSFGRKNTLQANTICNPSWESIDKITYVDMEGCLSFPSLWIPVTRYNRIRVTYQDIAGRHFEHELRGLEARVFQHESDHLDGKTFVDDLPDEVLEQINRLFVK